MAMTNDQMLAALLNLLGLTDDASGRAAFCLDSATSIALNYCNIDELPEGLKRTVIRMACDLYRSEGYGAVSKPHDVTSITRGDVSTSFGVIDGGSAEGSVLKNYNIELRRYRKVVFS